MEESINFVTIVGNRPQFIKMAPVSIELASRGYNELIVHTGQHYDENMSQIFFDELGIPEPHINLTISGKTHAEMTGEIMIKAEELLLQQKPKWVMIYGDTNSTLAAALAAVKLCIPIAHVEAGPRIYDINTPEEINRVVADYVSTLRFCPDVVSVQNLAKENIVKGVYFTGDTMYDAFLKFSRIAEQKSHILRSLDLVGKEYALMTIHRPFNTDTMEACGRIAEVLENSEIPVVFPVHPRTEASLKRFDLWEKVKHMPEIKAFPAVGYIDMLQLINKSKIILTDSGGLQKEAFFAGKPVMVFYHTSPWTHMQSCGWLRCYANSHSIDVGRIIRDIVNYPLPESSPDLFGNGKAAQKIVDILVDWKCL
jgi:UDP-N-acetylglucosamine 2-epimerase